MATPCTSSPDRAAYDAAVARLPEAYAVALRCTEAGLAAEEICARLDIEPECLGPLLDLAQRKLRTELTRA